MDCFPGRVVLVSSNISFRLFLCRVVYAGNGRGGVYVLISYSCITGYMKFHHILLFLAGQDPRWVEESNRRVERFVTDPSARCKDHVEDLGRWVWTMICVYLLV